MVAHFDAIGFMGVGRIFSRVGIKWIFPGEAKNIFPGEGQSDKNSFYPLETKKTTFFVKNLIGKCQFSNYMGGKPPFPLPTRMVRLFMFLIV